MIAVDTNVVVRFLIPDHPPQTEAARQVFASGSVFVGITVLLETEWVMRGSFKIGRRETAAGLERLLGLSEVVVPQRQAVAVALEAMAEGADFADALHASVAPDGAEAFVTFDRDFARHAAAIDGLPAVRLLAAD
ncbi:MAG: type II toxin-antitoxin system VapC family toxin [Bauldia sp.]|nr:type II toxin-antitoxin system VapC family toxin [Bauldia sp.]